jgi:hypothetical protein
MVVEKLLGFGSVLLVAGGIVGCAASPPPATPSEQASQRERGQCAAFRDDSAIADVLSGRAIESVSPLATGVQSKSSSPRLQGAVLTVAPIRGASAEWLARALECHGVERSLGRSSTLASAVDPFVLPGSLVHITVDSSRDGFRVELVGATTADAREILSRAEAFFAPRGGGGALASDLSGL